MRLPEQLADAAHELARHGRSSAHPASYAAGVRDTLTFMGELMRLAASSLPAGGGHPDQERPPTPSTRLRHLGAQLQMLIALDVADDGEAGLPTEPGQSALFDLVRAHSLVVEAAERLERPGPPARHADGQVEVDEAETASGSGTWLAAFVIAVVGQRQVDEQDVVDVLRLSGHSPSVLEAAEVRVRRTEGISAATRTEAAALLERARSVAADLTVHAGPR